MVETRSELLTFDLPAPFVAGFSTRRLVPDDLTPAKAVRRTAAALGAPEAETVRARQVHGSAVHVLDAPPCPGRDIVLPDGDALLTDQPGRVLAVVTADCVPIVLVDPDGGWIGAVHAGWRGTAAGVLGAALDLLESRGVALSRLHCALGPSIGRDRYEVGPEVVAALKDACSPFHPGPAALREGEGDRSYVDVAAFNRAVLLSRGVSPSQIHVSGLCTASRPDLFPSYRRDGKGTGRIVTAVLRRAG